MVEIRLSNRCNLNCVFCHIPQLKPRDLSLAEVIEIINRQNHQEADDYVITGGEPTLKNYLPVIMEYIKAKNKNHKVQIQTNGLLFNDEAFLKKVITAGLDDILLAFHSHEKRVYEKITRVPGSFNFAEKALELLGKYNLDIKISYVICSYNYATMPETFAYLDKKIPFSSALIANMFEKINYLAKRDYNLEISAIKEVLNRSLEFLHEKNKNITTCGIPICYLNGFEDTYMTGQYDHSRYFKKAATCEKCVFGPYCRGLIGEYADLYGTGELTPVLAVNEDVLAVMNDKKEKFLQANIYKYNNCQEK